MPVARLSIVQRDRTPVKHHANRFFSVITFQSTLSTCQFRLFVVASLVPTKRVSRARKLGIGYGLSGDWSCGGEGACAKLGVLCSAAHRFRASLCSGMMKREAGVAVVTCDAAFLSGTSIL